MLKFLFFIFSINFYFVPSFSNAFVFENEAVPGEYVVKIKSDIHLSLFSKKTLSHKEKLWIENEFKSHLKDYLPEARLMVLAKSPIETRDSVIQSIKKNPMVEYVEPNYLYRSLVIPNDSSYSEQWAFKFNTQSVLDVGAEAAWDITTGSENVIVGIIDSGIDYNHPDLKQNMWINPIEASGKLGVDDDNNGFVDDLFGADFTSVSGGGNPIDNRGHGSHCAGTIGALGNNGYGIAGLNWTIRLMGLKFIGSDGTGSLDSAVRAIDYAIKYKVQILNNSWGSYAASKALEEAIGRAHQAGILFVAAAGNYGIDNNLRPIYPASYKIPNVIAVAASDEKGELPWFSNFGNGLVHLAAPGVSIYGIWKSGEFASPSGTSMAAPFVTGIAALILSKEPQLTHLEIKERLIKTVNPMPAFKSKTISGGIVNAYRALKNDSTTYNANSVGMGDYK